MQNIGESTIPTHGSVLFGTVNGTVGSFGLFISFYHLLNYDRYRRKPINQYYVDNNQRMTLPVINQFVVGLVTRSLNHCICILQDW